MQIGPITLTRPKQKNTTRSKDTTRTPVINEDNIIHSTGGPGLTKFPIKIRVPYLTYIQLEQISEWAGFYPIDVDGLSVEQLGVSGYGYITDVKINSVLASVVDVSFDVTLIEIDPNVFLKMDYLNGNESGATVPMTYPDTVNETPLNDDFTTFDTTNTWEEPLSSGLSSSSVTGDGKLNLTGTATTSKTLGTVFIASKVSYKPPFTLYFDLEWLRYSTTYSHRISVGLYSVKPTSTNEKLSNDQMEAMIDIGPSSAQLMFRRYLQKGGTTWMGVADVLSSSTEKNPSIAFVVDGRGYLTIYKNTTGSNPTKVWGNANLNMDYDEGFYIGITMWNWKNTSETVKMNGISITKTVKTNPKNVLPMPVESTIIDVNNEGNFVRKSEDGDIYCGINPSGDQIFQTNFEDFDKGSVKVFNGVTDTTSHRIFNNENIFSKTSWYATNGIIKLFTETDNTIVYEYWNGTNYVRFKEFGVGELRYIKPYYISSEHCIIQINDTYWHLFRGKPYMIVEHSRTDITMELATCYYHDAGTTTSPSANADISMETNFYCNIWNKGSGTCTSPNPVNDIRLQIIQTKPTTIKSDKIPATETTGIGHYDITKGSDPDVGDTYLFNAREFFNLVDTEIIF